jgi:hypothetical protein
MAKRNMAMLSTGTIPAESNPGLGPVVTTAPAAVPLPEVVGEAVVPIPVVPIAMTQTATTTLPAQPSPRPEGASTPPGDGDDDDADDNNDDDDDDDDDDDSVAVSMKPHVMVAAVAPSTVHKQVKGERSYNEPKQADRPPKELKSTVERTEALYREAERRQVQHSFVFDCFQACFETHVSSLSR